MRPSVLPILVLLASLPAVPLRTSAQEFPPDEELELMVRFIARDGGTPGLVLGVLEADGSTRVLAHGIGGNGARPLGPNSVFEIGSITKTFTATLLADMVRRGEVALDDPVANYLPEDVAVPTRGDREITLLHLATHTSGLPAMPANLGPRNPIGLYPDYTVDSLYAFLSSHELRAVPGTGYLYSNLGYGLLGHALARAAETTYRQLLRDRILEPLGMTMTDVAVPGAATDGLVRGHRRGQAAPYWVGTEAFQGAGAIRSTAEDMLKYLEANVGPPSTDLERAMRMTHARQVPRSADPDAGYGLAWTRIARGDDPPLILHGGVTVGFSARAAFDPEREVATILLANDFHFGFQHGGGAGLLFPLPPDREWVEAEVAAGLLAQYQGHYRQRPGRGSYDVRLEDDGHLTLGSGGEQRRRLFATSDSTFHLLGAPMSLTFRSGQDGPVVMESRARREPDGAARWIAVAGPPGSRLGDVSRRWPLLLLVGVAALLALLGARYRQRRS